MDSPPTDKVLLNGVATVVNDLAEFAPVREMFQTYITRWRKKNCLIEAQRRKAEQPILKSQGHRQGQSNSIPICRPSSTHGRTSRRMLANPLSSWRRPVIESTSDDKEEKTWLTNCVSGTS